MKGENKMQQGKMYLGKSEYINNGTDMADTFLHISEEDEKVSKDLYNMKYYNQAVYFLLQSMEKYVKHVICKKIDATKPYFAEKIRETGHSIDKSLNFLIEIIVGNDKNLKEQIELQIRHTICRGLKFTVIHNAVRYPTYSEKKNNYKTLSMNAQDYDELYKIYNALKKFLKDFDRI